MKMCPHCGLKYEPSDLDGRPYVKHSPYELVPPHAENFAWGDEFEELCPGTEQRPRNPESDKRPLWQEGGVS